MGLVGYASDIKEKEESSMRKFNAIILIFAVAFVLSVVTGTGVASAEKSFKEASKDAGRATVNYPANVVNESAKTVGRAVKGTADTVVDTVKTTGKAMVGKENPANVVRTPVEGTGRTLKEATVDTVKTPVEAGKKTKEQIDQY
jgi:hypothetical protein